MRVIIYNLFTEAEHTIEGDPTTVEKELLRQFPWLRTPVPDGDIAGLVNSLNYCSSLEAHIADGPIAKSETDPESRSNAHVVEAFSGHHPGLTAALKAARFMAGSAHKENHEARQALYDHDGDHEAAALACHGLEVNEANLKALRALTKFKEFAKAEAKPIDEMTVVAGTPDAVSVAETVATAFKDDFVVGVELGGKHSAGSMLARDDENGETWLLKPGVGSSPAAGEDEESASQSRREAAFYHLAEAWGVGQWYPEAQLLLVDGKEYAAIRLLPWSWNTVDKLKEESPGTVRDLLQPFLSTGILHKWAVLDYVAGNVDRHAGNLMYRAGDIRLIDHGSTFVGEGFAPGHDKNSFVPAYLRAWTNSNFSAMSSVDKLKHMPRLGRQGEEDLADWIDGLDSAVIKSVCTRYGINPVPAVERLARVKLYMSRQPSDLAVNRIWIDS